MKNKISITAINEAIETLRQAFEYKKGFKNFDNCKLTELATKMTDIWNAPPEGGDNKKKYYYVSYNCKPSYTDPYIGGMIVDMHPLQWVMECNSKGGGKYSIIAWQEITKEQYNLYKDKI